MPVQSKLLNTKGEEAGSIELKDEIFGQKARPQFLHEYVTVYLANQRRGTASTKSKAEVSGSGKKPWKQKHTGRARAGSIRSPLWRHGGVTFGPRPHSQRRDLPRAKARAALAQALSAAQAEGKIIFVDGFTCPDGKTKSVASALKALGGERSALLVVDRPDAQLARAGRNIASLEIALPGDLNAYSVLRSRSLIITKAALETLAARWN